MIHLDPNLLEEFRRCLKCQFCDKPAMCVPHHYHGRGMGGGSQLDVRENLIALCPQCHDDAHWSRIDRADILAKIAAREKITPEVCQERIWKLLAKPKPRYS